MALNTTDVRQRAYKPIDVCSAGGSWIDEPAYNKNGAAKTVRMGNWLDEERLHNSMSNVDYSSAPSQPREEEGGKRGKHVSKAPNLQSSVFLTSHTAIQAGTAEAASHYQTSYGTSFTGAQPLPNAAGVRRKLLEEQIMAEAEQNMTERITMKPSGTQGWVTHNNDTNRHAPQVRATPYDPAEEHTSYLSEQAISVYSNQRVTGMTANTADVPHKRNANFSTPIGSFNKSTTPAY
jgi:hypothetical protein